MLLALPLGAQAVDMFRPLYFIGGVPLQGPVDKTTAAMKGSMPISATRR